MQRPPAIAFDALDREIKSAFTAVWTGRMDNDSFNQLTLSAGIPWRMVTVLRAYCRYLLQTGLPFSQGYIAQVLENNASISRLLADLFTARFDPQLSAPARGRHPSRGWAGTFSSALEEVTRSDEDRILRALWNALSATVRTNAYQPYPSGQLKEYLSFKLESQQLRELPLPKPLFEIFVFSPRMEGVHLRMGYVARGGIRWSDRREDFRTEMLGLMKAQQVKNTVIVPVGAKGGFIVRRMPAEREAQQAEVIACYQTLIRGLLDITDNIVDEKIAPPRMVVRHDRDDAYLVVAADKGTATFSDIANAISAGILVLAGRRVCFRRFGRLRPQKDGDHGARRLGMRQAALPRDRHGHPNAEFLGLRDRGHGRRRVWQRHAAIAAYTPDRRVQSPAHLHRSARRMPPVPSPSANACSTCRAPPGRTIRARRSPRAAGFI